MFNVSVSSIGNSLGFKRRGQVRVVDGDRCQIDVVRRHIRDFNLDQFRLWQATIHLGNRNRRIPTGHLTSGWSSSFPGLGSLIVTLKPYASAISRLSMSQNGAMTIGSKSRLPGAWVDVQPARDADEQPRPAVCRQRLTQRRLGLIPKHEFQRLVLIGPDPGSIPPIERFGQFPCTHCLLYMNWMFS